MAQYCAPFSAAQWASREGWREGGHQKEAAKPVASTTRSTLTLAIVCNAVTPDPSPCQEPLDSSEHHFAQREDGGGAVINA